MPSSMVEPTSPASAINLDQKLATFTDRWAPKIVEKFNGHDVMVVKVKGEFVWHSHANSDDFFLVLKGRLTIQLKDGDVDLNAGELYVVEGRRTPPGGV